MSTIRVEDVERGALLTARPMDVLEGVHHLAAWRESAWLTQRELAKRAGLAVTTVNEIETGKRQPNWKTLRKLAEVYEVAVVSLLKPPPPPAIREGESVLYHLMRATENDSSEVATYLAAYYQALGASSVAATELRKVAESLGFLAAVLADIADLSAAELATLADLSADPDFRADPSRPSRS